MKELEERAARMRELLDRHVATTKMGEHAPARNIAFEMMTVVTDLYNAAYRAAAEQSRRQGRIG